MSQALKYAAAYGLWLVDLGLTAWLFIMTRAAFLAFLALSYEQGDFRYLKRAQVLDATSAVLLGLGWLALFVLTEGYYRAGALEQGLTKRFARATGPILLCISVVELILSWQQGIGVDDWLRWLILPAEPIIGLALVVYGRKGPGESWRSKRHASTASEPASTADRFPEELSLHRGQRLPSGRLVV